MGIVTERENVDDQNSTRRIYKCDKDGCSKSFPKPSALKRHLEAHLKGTVQRNKEELASKKIHKCNVIGCTEAFTRNWALTRHLQKVHNPGKQKRKETRMENHIQERDTSSQLTCDVEKYDQNQQEDKDQQIETNNNTETKVVKQVGLKKKRDTKKHKCDEPGCGAVFYRPYRLQNHKASSHAGIKPFVCDYEDCDKKYTNESHLKRHIVKSHCSETDINKEVICGVEGCGRAFANKYSLIKHLAVIHTEFPFPCTKCDAKFKRKSYLHAHQLEAHGYEAPYKCAECPKTFIHYHLYNKHLGNHKTYECDCKETFDRWSKLLKHRRTECTCPKKEHKCGICDKTFAFRQNLTQHVLKVHLSDTQLDLFRCPYLDCKRSYKYKDNLNYHIKSFHEKIQGETFKCTQENCDMVLKSKKNLKQHLRWHSGLAAKVRKPRKPRKDKGISKLSMAVKLSGISVSAEEKHKNLKRKAIIDDDDDIENIKVLKKIYSTKSSSSNSNEDEHNEKLDYRQDKSDKKAKECTIVSYSEKTQEVESDIDVDLECSRNIKIETSDVSRISTDECNFDKNINTNVRVVSTDIHSVSQQMSSNIVKVLDTKIDVSEKGINNNQISYEDSTIVIDFPEFEGNTGSTNNIKMGMNDHSGTDVEVAKSDQINLEKKPEDKVNQTRLVYKRRKVTLRKLTNMAHKPKTQERHTNDDKVIKKKCNRKTPRKCDKPFCKAVFLRSDLKKHKRTFHRGKLQFKCGIKGCNDSFTYQLQLAKHMSTSHNKKFDIKCTNKKVFKCEEPFCDAAFNRPYKLQNHKQTRHSGKLPFKCSHAGCNNSYKYHKQLDSHRIRMHNENIDGLEMHTTRVKKYGLFKSQEVEASKNLEEVGISEVHQEQNCKETGCEVACNTRRDLHHKLKHKIKSHCEKIDTEKQIIINLERCDLIQEEEVGKQVDKIKNHIEKTDTTKQLVIKLQRCYQNQKEIVVGSDPVDKIKSYAENIDTTEQFVINLQRCDQNQEEKGVKQDGNIKKIDCNKIPLFDKTDGNLRKNVPATKTDRFGCPYSCKYSCQYKNIRGNQRKSFNKNKWNGIGFKYTTKNCKKMVNNHVEQHLSGQINLKTMMSEGDDSSIVNLSSFTRKSDRDDLKKRNNNDSEKTPKNIRSSKNIFKNSDNGNKNKTDINVKSCSKRNIPEENQDAVTDELFLASNSSKNLNDVFKNRNNCYISLVNMERNLKTAPIKRQNNVEVLATGLRQFDVNKFNNNHGVLDVSMDVDSKVQHNDLHKINNNNIRESRQEFEEESANDIDILDINMTRDVTRSVTESPVTDKVEAYDIDSRYLDSEKLKKRLNTMLKDIVFVMNRL